MSLRNFDYFLKIAEYMNITKAAEKLYISQPSLSKYLKSLEHEVGTPLFYRSVPLRLTEVGELYHQMAKNILAEENVFRQAVENSCGQARERLTIGIPVWRNSLFAPTFTLAFKERHPELDLRVQELFGFETDYEAELQTGKIDCCLCSSDTQSPKLIYHLLCQENLLLMGNNAHPVVRDYIASHTAAQNGVYPDFELRELEGEDFISFEAGQAQGRTIINELKAAHVKAGTLTHTTSINTAITSAAANRGFSFLPELGYTLGSIPQRISCFLITQPHILCKFCAVTTDKGQQMPSLQLYIRELREFCQRNLLLGPQAAPSGSSEPSFPVPSPCSLPGPVIE